MRTERLLVGVGVLGPLAEAGKVLGIRQTNVSRLMRGSKGAYSVERLIEFLKAQSVIHSASRGEGPT
ncbi:MAG: hypothetical protein EXQ49_05580 [Acidobacteria bacterium]|nr:hypothetical protein [Acidobacteriota bacterium]